MANRTKPAKPHPDFPLFPHRNGQWAKKVKQKLVYFGSWDNPQAALERWLDEKDELLAGRTPTRSDGTTVRELCNRFLASKKLKLQAREIDQTTFDGYLGGCRMLVDHFGKSIIVDALTPAHFTTLRQFFTETNGLVGLKNRINHARMVFKFAYDADIIAAPIKYGPDFSRPSKKSIRRNRTPRMLEAYEVRTLIDHANSVMTAMLYVGVNAGFGNKDVGTLPRKAINLKTGWIEFPRPKTGSPRRIPLWPESVAAIRAYNDTRPTPKPECEDLAFLTSTGGTWYTPKTRYLTEQFRKLVDRVDSQSGEEPIRRDGVGFYACRHVFRTIGAESRDKEAVDAIMGHEDGSMAAEYTERISDERLLAVTNTVRTWLFAEAGTSTDDKPAPLRIVG